MGAPMNDATQTLADQHHLTVDYGQSLQQMIAAGRYDWSNPKISAKRFPMRGIGTQSVVAKLFHFDRSLSPDDAVKAIKSAVTTNPWEPAKIEHLLAFGASNPDEQRHYPVIALGSVATVDGYRRMPYLNRSDARRGLDLDWWDYVRDDYCRFLAVRNRSSGA
jgi:hypothetical protein